LADAGRSGASTPLAADDMIGSLAARVRELSLRVAQLEGELEAARRRIGVYEDFDAQVQDSLSAALRAANQIRERAHVTASALAEEARAQRPGTATELDAIRLERDTLRRVIDDASASAPSHAAAAPAPTFPMSEMRVAATEALRGVFKELVAEIRAANPPTPVVAQSVTSPQPAPAPRPDNSPSSFAPPPVSPMPVVQRPASAPPPAAPVTVTPVASQPPPVAAPRPPQSWEAPTVPPPQPYSAPPSSYNVPTEQPLPRPTVVPPPPPAALVEDIDVAPAAVAPPPPPQPAAAAPAPTPQPQPVPAPPAQTYAPPANEPIGEVQVVLSPISSFPRLVELERRLQGMPVVRTVYARDFRNGIATLAVGLRHPMTVDEFAAAVTQFDYPRLRILSTSGYVLELRIDSEASSIA